MEKNNKETWSHYCRGELAHVTQLLQRHGYTLDVVQPHIIGERFLMQAVTTISGFKLILLGTNNRDEHVVIKASRDKNGIREINHERMCRNILTKIDFARDVFHSPKEIAYITDGKYVVGIQEFIDQKCTFLERPLIAQFDLALRAFKGQEGAHATTFKHRQLIQGVFGIRSAREYLHNLHTFQKNIENASEKFDEVSQLLRSLETYMTTHAEIIEQYCGFLTHTDFVPHNIRIKNDTIYLLDHSSLTFGNKYEGWARFINFMTLYNPPLQKALEQYIRDNRTPEESESLHLMRMYRLGEILWYYVGTLSKSSDDLHTLNVIRIHFWKDVLAHVLKRKEVPTEIIEQYKTMRDTLRTEDEKSRQKNLH